MRRVIAAALAVTLTVGAADAMAAFNAVKALIFGGVNGGPSVSPVTPDPTPIPIPPTPPVSACASNLLLDYSDACNLMAQMTGN